MSSTKALVLMSLVVGLAAPVLATELQDLYRSYKSNNEEAPQWLTDALFPPVESGGQRTGGDTYGSATAIPFVPGSTYSDAGTTAGLTGDYDYTTAPATCNTSFFGVSFNGPDAVYTFTLPTWYTVSASTCNMATYDSCLGIVNSAGVLMAVNDDGSGCSSYSSLIPGCCLPPDTYFVIVDAYGSGSGPYTLDVTFGASPCVTVNPCDTFVDNNITLPFHGTDDNTGDPDVIGGDAGDIGYTFTLLEDSYVELATCFAGTTIDSDSYWYMNGGPCNGGTYLGYNDGEGACNWATHVVFDCTAPLLAGTYTVVLSGYYSYSNGPFELDIQAHSCVVVDANDQPVAYSLSQNVPNPFNPTTTIAYSMQDAGMASLKVFDLAGRTVATLVDGMVEKGQHTVSFDASNLSSGVYFYTLQAGATVETKKMVLMK